MNPREHTGIDEENGLQHVVRAPDTSPVETHGKSIEGDVARHLPNDRRGRICKSSQRVLRKKSPIGEAPSECDSSRTHQISEHKKRAREPQTTNISALSEKKEIYTHDEEKRKQKRPLLSLMDQLRAPWSIWSILFLFVSIGFALSYTHQNSVVVFVINFLAIIPSKNLL